MPIKLLDEKLISRIAAGEVIERPASVVKELVENSLDAGADQVSVEVKGGGVDLVRVADNGSGIPEDEVEIAFYRHATSKLGSFDDLYTIRSLGFRGEALPSIAAVSRVELITCADSQSAGSCLVVEDGTVIDRHPQGRPVGTTVSVQGLFRRVPARLKFLRSAATENGRIADVVSQYALAFPEVAFRLTVDGRQALRTPGNGALVDSILAVYGADTARQMLEIRPVEWSDGQAGPLVSGRVGAPSLGRASRNYISLFVNRRAINSRLLSWAVEEAYHGLLPAGKHPVAVINIEVPAGEVDVNIHPAKSEVKFRDERRVFVAVQKAVRGTLVAQAPVPRIEEATIDFAVPPPSAGFRGSAAPARSQPEKTTAEAMPPPLALALPVLRVVGQVMGTYIVAEGPDGLYLIDQHAAHERIVYEEVKRQRQRREVSRQGLLAPATFEVTPGQDEVLRARCGELSDFGFDIEPFGDRTYLVRAVPELVPADDWSEMLRELLDALAGGEDIDFEEKVAVSIACHRRAVRAGQVLSDSEMKALVRQLESTELPHTCPHGRPTLIQLDNGQLRRHFGRS